MSRISWVTAVSLFPGFFLLYYFRGDSLVYTLYGLLAQTLAAGFAGQLLLRVGVLSDVSVRTGWFLTAIGLWIWSLTGIMEILEEAVLDLPDYATVADIFAIFGYLPVLAGLILLNRRLRSSTDSSSAASLSIFLIGGFALLMKFYIWPHLSNPDRDIAQKTLDALYPGLDFALITVCAFLIRNARTRHLDSTWVRLLLFGLSLPLIADFCVFLQGDEESLLFQFLDIAYYGSYVLIAWAAAKAPPSVFSLAPRS